MMNRLIRIGLISVALAAAIFSYAAFAADGDKADLSSAPAADATKELDTKIANGLKSREKDFSAESLRLVAQLWLEYREAWLSGKPVANTRGSGGTPAADVAGYNDYVGTFAVARPGATRPASRQKLIEVVQDGGGRFLVKLEGHTLPAVACNNRLWVTTGDIVYAPGLPDFGAKAHASLEMFTIVRVGGKYYFAGTNSRDMEKDAMLLTPSKPTTGPASY